MRSLAHTYTNTHTQRYTHIHKRWKKTAARCGASTLIWTSSRQYTSKCNKRNRNCRFVVNRCVREETYDTNVLVLSLGERAGIFFFVCACMCQSRVNGDCMSFRRAMMRVIQISYMHVCVYVCVVCVCVWLMLKMSFRRDE